jgi:hypothetical protein
VERSGKLSKRGKPQKTKQAGKKEGFLEKVAVTVVGGLIVGVLLRPINSNAPPLPSSETLVKRADPLPPPETLPKMPEEEADPLPPPPAALKTETIRLTVTPTETASASVFDGDVQIMLTKVIGPYKKVFCKIMVYSSGEPLRSFEELTEFDLQKIGDYEINVEKIGDDYADFRIVRRQR